MKQELEKSLYEVRPAEEQAKIYVVGNLESLSASALYYGNGPKLPLEKGFGEGLTIRPFSGFQLHIHEKPGGIAHLKYPDSTYTEINSYDAAMADLLADKLSIKKLIKK